MKNQKKKENNIDDKVTIDTTPVTKSTGKDTPNASAQYSGSTDSYLPYSLRNHKFVPYSTNTMKNQKKKENKIDDKKTINPSPATNAPGDDTPNAFSQDDECTDSNSPHLLRNRKFGPYSKTTTKNQKKKGGKWW